MFLKILAASNDTHAILSIEAVCNAAIYPDGLRRTMHTLELTPCGSAALTIAHRSYNRSTNDLNRSFTASATGEAMLLVFSHIKCRLDRLVHSVKLVIPIQRSSMTRMQHDAKTQTKFVGTEKKRHTVLQSAEELFLTNGFNGTSMDEVAIHAGVSKQTVYNQFANKASLFIEIVQSMTAQAAKRVQNEMREPKNLAEVAVELKGHAERLLTIVMTPRLLRLRRLVIAEADRFPELGRALYDGGPGRAIAGLVVSLQRWASRDLLSIQEARIAATQFNWLVMGEPINQAMFRPDYVMPKAERDQHIEHAVRVFIAAYRTKTKRATMNRKTNHRH